MVRHWRAYYTDNRQFDSDEYDWSDLPDDGVLGVKLWFEDGHQCVYGFDWYFHVPDTNLFAGNNDTLHEIRDRYGDVILKRGKWIPSDDWRRVKKEIQRDDY